MCLFDRKRFRFATKRIKIWKIVTNDNRSPFKHVPLKKVNITFNGSPEYTKDLVRCDHNSWIPYVYSKGFFMHILLKIMQKNN